MSVQLLTELQADAVHCADLAPISTLAVKEADMSEEEQQQDTKEDFYAIFAEAEGHEKPLIQLDMTFARLLDDVVVPYQTGEPFFIDGAPLTAQKLKRIKILKLNVNYAGAKWGFERGLTRGEAQMRKIYGDQYNTRFEHVLRDNSDDVTAQVIKAYNQAIKPSIKDYLPKRDELISAATKIFVEAIRVLGS